MSPVEKLLQQQQKMHARMSEVLAQLEWFNTRSVSVTSHSEFDPALGPSKEIMTNSPQQQDLEFSEKRHRELCISCVSRTLHSLGMQARSARESVNQ